MTDKIEEATAALQALELPRAQLNERSALSLLALLDLRPDGNWQNAAAPLLGITPIMTWMRDHYGKEYAPNTRETVRRQTMHQFVQAGIAAYNPDDPKRAVNSPAAVYQITHEARALLATYGTAVWAKKLAAFHAAQQSLAQRYARERDMNMVPVKLAGDAELRLSPGDHSTLIKAIVEEFAPRFAPGAKLVYAGDTGQKVGHFDEPALATLGVKVDRHGKLPDVVLHDTKRNWLLLVEAVTSHGPVDAKRHEELAKLFAGSTAGLVYVTAFPSRAAMSKYLPLIAWETEVWTSDAPTHLIHFNGERFLGPYGGDGSR